MQLKELMGDCYVLCLCEGGAETAIIDMLLDHDKLIFTRNDLINNKIHKRECVEKIQEKYLGLRSESACWLVGFWTGKVADATLAVGFALCECSWLRSRSRSRPVSITFIAKQRIGH